MHRGPNCKNSEGEKTDRRNKKTIKKLGGGEKKSLAVWGGKSGWNRERAREIQKNPPGVGKRRDPTKRRKGSGAGKRKRWDKGKFGEKHARGGAEKRNEKSSSITRPELPTEGSRKNRKEGRKGRDEKKKCEDKKSVNAEDEKERKRPTGNRPRSRKKTKKKREKAKNNPSVQPKRSRRNTKRPLINRQDGGGGRFEREG